MNTLYLTETEASQRYKYSVFWFQRCRWSGDGPPFLKIKRKILYPIEDTDAWFKGHGLFNKASEYSARIEVKNEL